MRQVILAGWLAAALVTGCESEPPMGATAPSRVQIVDFDGLSPPAVGRERVYRPVRRTATLSGGTVLDVAVFHVAVDTTLPDELGIWMTDGEASASALTKLPDSAVGDAGADTDAALARAEAAQALLQGRGVYWLNAAMTAAHQLTHWYGVVVPAATIRVGTHVAAAASRTAEGAPLRGDALELAPSFFYVAALGDSAMWGNGLREEDKFSTRVAREIEAETQQRVIRLVYAVSGASIETYADDAICLLSCTGEAPKYYTSITLQALSMERPELMDLLLVNGCGNDISLGTIISPLDETAKIQEAAQEFCYGAMIGLLGTIRQQAPQAPIVVTGYFPFLSEKSDLSSLDAWAESQGIDLGEPEDYADLTTNFVANSTTFASASTENLTRAVEFAASRSADDSAIVYADAGFTANNATFAADAWLWGLTANADVLESLDIHLDIVPEDPLLDFRIQACQAPVVAPGLLACIYGSAGHPNPKGAEAYTRAIVAKLREIGVLPAEARSDGVQATE